MALETSTYINGLVVANPPDSDPKSQGAGHLKLLKSTIKATFPNISGAVTPTHAELNFVDGVTSPIQTQLDNEALARANADNAEALTRADADTALDNAKAPKASPTFTGTVTLPPTGSGSTEAVRKDYADALAFAAALPAQSGNSGKVVTTDGTAASWESLKTINGQTILGSGGVNLGPRNYVVAQYTASATFVVPPDTFVIRPYAFGAGAAATTTASGGGGGCAYGDVAVTPGANVTLSIAAGVAKLTYGGVDLLIANPASGVTAGTASKHVSVTNGGAYSGGAGATGNYGGASSGSPLGNGVSTGTSAGGCGWGGGGGGGSGGGGVGGPSTTTAGGDGLVIPSADPLLDGLTGRGGTSTPNGGGAGGPGGGGGSASTAGAYGGAGGFGAGGGACAQTSGRGGAGGFGGGGGTGGQSGGGASGGAGGFGGGGGKDSLSPGAGGPAVIRIYY